jgi:sensor histidine kinase YesM
MKKYIEVLIHLLIWGISYFVILDSVSTIADYKKGEGPFWLAILFGLVINQIIFYTTAFFIVPRFLGQKKIGLLIAVLIIGFLIMNLFESLIDYYWLVGFFSTESESFFSYVKYNGVNSFLILLLALTYAFIIFYLKNEKLKRALHEEKLTTEMAFLKSQINPHFLFNVLNSFYAKALKNNVPDLADGIAKLADLMRYMVYETNEDKVLLEKEIQHLKNFIEVYQLRIAEEDEVAINFEIIGDIAPIKIRPMLLIPFVENAIKHGINPQEKSEINIRVEVIENKLYFKVSNTIVKDANGIQDNSSGFGLGNLKTRLAVLYPNAHTLETTIEKGCFIAELSLQLN